MIVATHQPDLLPYSGFWYKMAKADVFDLKVYDQFLRRGYQRRVMMRDSWASVPVHPCPQQTPIIDVRIDPDEARTALVNTIQGRYGGARFFKQRGPQIVERVMAIHTDRLWQFNLDLMLVVRDALGIRTPISLGPPALGAKSAGIVSVLRDYGASTYLSGTGARTYMGDCREFTEAGIGVEFSRHRAVTGDSILTVLFDHEEPMEVVLAENDDIATGEAPSHETSSAHLGGTAK